MKNITICVCLFLSLNLAAREIVVPVFLKCSQATHDPLKGSKVRKVQVIQVDPAKYPDLFEFQLWEDIDDDFPKISALVEKNQGRREGDYYFVTVSGPKVSFHYYGSLVESEFDMARAQLYKGNNSLDSTYWDCYDINEVNFSSENTFQY